LTDILESNSDDDEKTGTRNGDAEWIAESLDEDIVSDIWKHSDKAKRQGTEEVEAVDGTAKVLLSSLTWTYAFNKAALLMRVLFNLLRVEDDARVEVGEHYNEYEVDCWVDEIFALKTDGSIEILCARCGEPRYEVLTNFASWISVLNELADECWDRQECDCKDDWNDTSGDKLDWHDRFNTTVGGVTADALCVVDGNNTLCLIDFNEEVKDNNQTNAEG